MSNVGRAPEPGEITDGCPFAPRCPRADDQCLRQEPGLVRAGPEHRVARWHPTPPGTPHPTTADEPLESDHAYPPRTSAAPNGRTTSPRQPGTGDHHERPRIPRLPPSRVVVAWHEGDTNPLIRSFVRIGTVSYRASDSHDRYPRNMPARYTHPLDRTHRSPAGRLRRVKPSCPRAPLSAPRGKAKGAGTQ
ncbi:hypothetical protein ACFRMN_15920 [Streptomyces sp. NPDC056835]|uniref:hypothetical protein n=1 Tax=Streptomyces sp. NPDC056835 TaxID=3345956 RepID=UPI0036864671